MRLMQLCLGVGLFGSMVGAMPQGPPGRPKLPPTKEEIMKMMDCEMPKMSGIACEYNDESFAELKEFMDAFDAENEDAGVIMKMAADTANNCKIYEKPEEPPRQPGMRGPPGFVMEMLQPSEEEGINRMVFGVVIPSEKPCNFSAIYGGGGGGPPSTAFGGDGEGRPPKGDGEEMTEEEKEAAAAQRREERKKKRIQSLMEKTCEEAKADADYMENCYLKVEFEDRKERRKCRKALKDLCVKQEGEEKN